MESIRALEKYSAPLLIAMSIALLVWAVTSAGGFGPMLSTPSQFGPGMPKEGQLLSVLIPAGKGQPATAQCAGVVKTLRPPCCIGQSRCLPCCPRGPAQLTHRCYA